MWISRPTRGCCCPIRTRCRRSSCGSSARRRSSRRSSARTPARSLLLPKRRPGMRAPLWQQRKRAADLLAVASRYGSFPVLLETYRECLRDFFDMPALVATLADVRSRKLRVVTVDSERPSPFAASLLFSYVASFLYDGDAPLAERRAQALAVDQAQLRELIGDAELRELLDADAMDAIERQLQRLDPQYPREERRRRPRHAAVARRSDAGRDRSRESLSADVAAGVERARRRAARPQRADRRRAAVSSRSRTRRAIATRLGVPLPPGLPESLLEPVARSARRSRAALRAHARAVHRPPTSPRGTACRPRPPKRVLMRLTGRGPAARRRVPARRHAARVDRRRRAAHAAPPLAREAAARDRAGRSAGARPVRHDVAGHRQAPARAPTRCSTSSSSCRARRSPASILETEILPARLEDLRPGRSRRRDGGRRGRLGRRRTARRARRPRRAVSRRPPRATCSPARRSPVQPSLRHRARRAILEHLAAPHGASFFGPLHDAVGGGYPGGDRRRALESRVARRSSRTTRSTRCARSRARGDAPRQARPSRRRAVLPIATPRAAVGRRTLEPRLGAHARDTRAASTRQAAALAQQLLARHGVLTREAVAPEIVPGGFGSIYPVLKAMEDSGRIRRGYFVAGLGATQFALPGALDLLRSLRDRRPMKPPRRRGAGRDRSGEPVRHRGQVSRFRGYGRFGGASPARTWWCFGGASPGWC